MACRGTGQVISNLGGSTTTVTCPWCRGGGVRLSDVDAQQPWHEAAEAGAANGDKDPPSGGPPAGGEAA